ncbi:MAG: queuosine precursor transporter [Nitrososphaerales archaeon]
MLILIFAWLLSLFIATFVSSYYVRVKRKPDAIIATYVVYLTMSQIIAAKIAVFDFGLLSFTVPAAVLIFPFTFQLTDMVNEYFGRMETHRMIFIAFITQVLMVFFIFFSNTLPPADFWNLQEPWTIIFNLSIRITIASWTSFLITENLDAILFAKIREKTGKRHLWVRSVLSDAPMLALDSLIFVTLAFYGVYDPIVIVHLIIGQIITKWFSGLVDTPFIYLEGYVVESEMKWMNGISQRLGVLTRLFKPRR